MPLGRGVVKVGNRAKSHSAECLSHSMITSIRHIPDSSTGRSEEGMQFRETGVEWLSATMWMLGTEPSFSVRALVT